MLVAQFEQFEKQFPTAMILKPQGGYNYLMCYHETNVFIHDKLDNEMIKYIYFGAIEAGFDIKIDNEK